MTVKEATYNAEGRQEQRCTVCEQLLDFKPIPKLSLPTIKIQTPSTTKIRYGETLDLHLNLKDIPEGVEVQWSASSDCVKTESRDGGLKFSVTSEKTGDVTITVKLVDKDGNVLRESEALTLRSKAGFFQKLRYWFGKLFGKSFIIPQALDYLDRYYDVF